MSDLSTLIPKETTILQLKHPVTGELLPSKIELYGSHTRKFNTLQHAVRNRLLKKGTKIRSAEQIEADNMSVLVGCTKSWENVEWQGKELPCTPENVKMLYTEVVWVKLAVDEAIGNDANFFV